MQNIDAAPVHGPVEAKNPRLGILVVLAVCTPFWAILAWLAVR